jgi:hypothetical protein
VPAVDRVLNYVHQRTLQHFTLDAIHDSRAAATAAEAEAAQAR